MSPRAAWRLETLGFREVYDYVPGKQDWMSAGLPTEGEIAGEPRAATVARQDVPTCSLDERVGDVRDRVRTAGFDVCVVVNDERIVLGLLRGRELDAAADARVSDVMRPGPSTFRPNVPIQEMAEFMVKHDVPSAPITTPEGVLMGLLVRDDAVRVAHEAHRHHHEEADG